MSEIKDWSTTAASNNSASPDGFPENMAPSGVNDSAREVMAQVRAWYEAAEWINEGHTYTYSSATVFTIGGGVDRTGTYAVQRRVRAVGSTTGTIYGRITASSYSNPTNTITVAWDSGSLQNETLQISYGLHGPTNPGLDVRALDGLNAFFQTGSNGGLKYGSDVVRVDPNDATEITSVDPDADYLLVSDGSDSDNLKKALVANATGGWQLVTRGDFTNGGANDLTELDFTLTGGDGYVFALILRNVSTTSTAWLPIIRMRTSGGSVRTASGDYYESYYLFGGSGASSQSSTYIRLYTANISDAGYEINAEIRILGAGDSAKRTEIMCDYHLSGTAIAVRGGGSGNVQTAENNDLIRIATTAGNFDSGEGFLYRIKEPT